jgi:hypothetical protein
MCEKGHTYLFLAFFVFDSPPPAKERQDNDTNDEKSQDKIEARLVDKTGPKG